MSADCEPLRTMLVFDVMPTGLVLYRTQGAMLPVDSKPGLERRFVGAGAAVTVEMAMVDTVATSVTVMVAVDTTSVVSTVETTDVALAVITFVLDRVRVTVLAGAVTVVAVEAPMQAQALE